MDDFIRLMNSPSGRLGRISLGVAMLAFGLRRGGVFSALVAFAGLMPMVPAFFGHCA